jgi:hypothetical protein
MELGLKVLAALEILVHVAVRPYKSSRSLVHLFHAVKRGCDLLSVGPKQAADIPAHASHAYLRRAPIIAEVHIGFLSEFHLAAFVAR